MGAPELEAVAADVVYGAAYPSRYGVAWAVWRGVPSGPPTHHDFVPGRGERFYAELCVCAFARGVGPRTEVRWLDDDAAARFVTDDPPELATRRAAWGG